MTSLACAVPQVIQNLAFVCTQIFGLVLAAGSPIRCFPRTCSSTNQPAPIIWRRLLAPPQLACLRFIQSPFTPSRLGVQLVGSPTWKVDLLTAKLAASARPWPSFAAWRGYAFGSRDSSALDPRNGCLPGRPRSDSSRRQLARAPTSAAGPDLKADCKTPPPCWRGSRRWRKARSSPNWPCLSWAAAARLACRTTP